MIFNKHSALEGQHAFLVRVNIIGSIMMNPKLPSHIRNFWQLKKELNFTILQRDVLLLVKNFQNHRKH